MSRIFSRFKDEGEVLAYFGVPGTDSSRPRRRLLFTA
jgi:hypothetical protein